MTISKIFKKSFLNRKDFFVYNLFLSIIGVSLAFQSCQQKKELPHADIAVLKKVLAPQLPALPDSMCIAAVGDIMMGTSFPNNSTLPPDSGKNSFKVVEQYLQNADVAFGNLEGTLLDKGTPAFYKMHFKSKAYLFKMPVSYGMLLKNAGFDVVSLANNHIGDFGDEGRISTVKTLDSCGIYYAGLQTYPSVIFKKNGIKYGFCSFAPNSHTVSIFDHEAAGAIIRELKKNCDVVIVSFHGGGEGPMFEHITQKSESYFGEKRGNVYSFAHNAIDNGADLIFGNGPHVSRAIELYKNRLIAYSLGNFCTYRCVSVEGVCGIAPLLRVYVNKKGEFLSARITSIRQTHDKGLQIDTLNRAAIRVKWLTETDLPQSGLSFSETGNIMASNKN